MYYLEQLLWFAFILLSLSYWKQPRLFSADNFPSCDLLSFYYLCRTGNNIAFSGTSPRCVVICFHFTIFVVLETTSLPQTSRISPLWFAFILLSLSYWKQLTVIRRCSRMCCDLLSFYYLCRTGNNFPFVHHIQLLVVICFHFTIFVVLETTCFFGGSDNDVLWFAFILLSLSYWKQLIIVAADTSQGCDLLSFYYLCRTGNNVSPLHPMDTTLWFAFILLSLSYWKQRAPGRPNKTGGCDLLSFYYLCRTGNNEPVRRGGRKPLWFAFILLSLSYWKQLHLQWRGEIPCCDLLSFYYLCRTGNNCFVRVCGTPAVVICFHFTIFVVLETTMNALILLTFLLWFAFILLSLSYWKQHTGSIAIETASCDLLSFYYLCRTGNNLHRFFC